MANRLVAGELYEGITGQLFEIGRQLRQGSGYPFSPEQLKLHLQAAIEGRFNSVQHVVDCDVKPFTPDGWKVEEHKKGGQLVLDMSKVRLHLSPNQMDGKVIEGNKLRKELANQPVLNANILDYLLAHPELIPEAWKRDANGNTRYIFFWGTIYRSSGGDLCVRCLCFRGGAWSWGSGWLDVDFGGRSPSALLAS